MCVTCVCLFRMLRCMTMSIVDVQTGEICQMETFRAECPADHVIGMESAQLGRLKIGMYTRCLYYGHVLVSLIFTGHDLCFSYRCNCKNMLKLK